MNSLLPQKYHSYIYIFSLVILAAGLPLSKFLISLSQIIMICNWVLEGNLVNKLRNFLKNKAALAASSILILHFIGLLYSTDLEYGLKDIRIKIPLLILPLIMSTSEPLSTDLKSWIMRFLIAAVTVSTVISALILADVIHRPVADVRYASIFISHVRLALLICVSICMLLWLILKEVRAGIKIIYAFVIAWFIIFLFLMESITGVSVLVILGLALILYKAMRIKEPICKISGLLLVLIFLSVSGLFIVKNYNKHSRIEPVDLTKLDKFTSRGNSYTHDISGSAPTENGTYVWIYYSEEELKEEWNKRSNFDYNWKDRRGNVLRFTLIRFLASKGLRKDADGLSRLSDDEIRAIEKGIANVDYMSKVTGRISEIIWEIVQYNKTSDASGHSITQRLEYWKAAIGIIQSSPVFGVGTGDVPAAFDQEYAKNQTLLKKQWRFRSHNQYLSITVAFGFFGLIWFLFSLIYPGLYINKFKDILYVSFFIIAIASFFTEDTLETQVGVTFFAFLNSFLLFTDKAHPEAEDRIID